MVGGFVLLGYIAMIGLAMGSDLSHHWSVFISIVSFECRLLADTVAKVFWVSERATLIQDRSPTRNVDSEMCSFRFNYCRLATRLGLLQQYRHKADVQAHLLFVSFRERCGHQPPIAGHSDYEYTPES